MLNFIFPAADAASDSPSPVSPRAAAPACKGMSGTSEWAKHTVNCTRGCSNNCRYCFARFDAVERFGRIKAKDWQKPVVVEEQVVKKRKLLDGTVMFPSTHDIVPENLDACKTLLRNLLEAGNKVLVVSKPQMVCMQPLLDMLMPYKAQVRIRFTITADDDAVLGFWEPGASSFTERMDCLKLAYSMGFETSVSIEPMLDPANIERLVATLTPFVRSSIWIGKLNHPRSRVQVKNATERAVLEHLLEQQSDAAILAIYARLKQHPLVQWKESIKKVVGLPLAEKPGEGE